MVSLGHLTNNISLLKRTKPGYYEHFSEFQTSKLAKNTLKHLISSKINNIFD